MCQSFLIHVSEASWRERRLRSQGRCKLTQAAYLCATGATLKAVPRQPALGKQFTHIAIPPNFFVKRIGRGLLRPP